MMPAHFHMAERMLFRMSLTFKIVAGNVLAVPGI
jgi:hypothetical protein